MIDSIPVFLTKEQYRKYIFFSIFNYYIRLDIEKYNIPSQQNEMNSSINNIIDISSYIVPPEEGKFVGLYIITMGKLSLALLMELEYLFDTKYLNKLVIFPNIYNKIKKF